MVVSSASLAVNTRRTVLQFLLLLKRGCEKNSETNSTLRRREIEVHATTVTVAGTEEVKLCRRKGEGKEQMMSLLQ